MRAYRSMEDFISLLKCAISNSKVRRRLELGKMGAKCIDKPLKKIWAEK